MNLKNENSKIYYLTKVSSILIIISFIVYFIVDPGTVIKNISLHLGLVFLGFLFTLTGTRKVFAQNNKKGYLDYLFATLYFIYSIRFFSF